MPSTAPARDEAVSFAINGKGYVGMGWGGGTTYYNTLWEYNPVTNTWTQMATFTLASARKASFSFALNGKGYFGTGYDGTYMLTGVFEYTPGTNTWAQKISFPGGARENATAFVIGQKAYVTGGLNASGACSDLWEYNSASDTWTSKAPLPLGRYSAVAFSIGSKGYCGTGYSTKYLNDFWKYDPIANNWSPIATLPGGVRALASGFSLGTRGFVAGGSDATVFPLSDVWEYNAFINGWTKKNPLPFGGRMSASVFVTGGKAYLGSGNNNTNSQTPNLFNDLWTYTPTLPATITFQKSYGGINDDTDDDAVSSRICSGSVTGDGGYIVASTTKSFGGNSSDIYLLRLNSAGDTVWTKTFGTDTADEIACSVKQTTDGGFIIAGMSGAYSASDMLILKTTSSGNFQWSHTIIASGIQRANYAEELAGGGYIITGRVERGGGVSGAALIKLDAAGNDMGSQVKTITRTSDMAEGYSLVQSATGGYRVSGEYLQTNGTPDAYLIFGDAAVNVFTSYSYFPSTTSTEERTFIKENPDGSYILCGTTNSTTGHGGKDIFLIKVGSLGNTILWSNLYGGVNDDVARAVILTPDGGYAIAGFTNSVGMGAADAFLLKVTSSGTTDWARTYGGSLDDKANALSLTGDGGYILFGETKSFSNGGTDVYVIKTDSLGKSFCNELATASFPEQGVSFSLTGPTTTAASVNTSAGLLPSHSIPTNKMNLCSNCTFPIETVKKNVTCFGTGTGTASVIIKGGVPPYAYAWSNNSTTSVVSGLAAGVYSVTVTDGNLCSATDIVKIAEPPPISINSSSDTTICQGGSATISANANGGTTPFSYLWSPATGLNCTNCQNTVATPTSSTQYIVYATDFNLCVQKATVGVKIYPLSNINAGTDQSLCSGNAVILGAASTTGMNYLWSPAAGLSSTTIANPTASPVITTTYILTATNAMGCSQTDDVVVSVLSSPLVNITASSYTMCAGTSSDTLTATSIPGAGYTWISFPPAIHPPNNSIIISPDNTTTYTVTVSDAAGCVGTATVAINVGPAYPTPIVSPASASYCLGDPKQPFTCTNPVATVRWVNQQLNVLQLGASFTPAVTAANSYTFFCFQGTDKYCLSYLAPVTMNIHSLPTANAGKDITVCAGVAVPLTASGGINYSWSPSTYLSGSTIANPYSTPDANISYEVIVTDANHCKDRDSITIYIAINDSCGIHIYNVLTPNGDGDNEVWWIDGINSFPDNTVQVYNRWGGLVWGKKGYDNKKVVWNGQDEQGQSLPAGTYYYVIHVQKKIYSGWVELVR